MSVHGHEGNNQPIIDSVPGVTGAEEFTKAQTGSNTMREWGGYTGNRFSAPVLGLPEGMSVQEAHVKAMEQAGGIPFTAGEPVQAEAPQTLITEVPKAQESEITTMGNVNVPPVFDRNGDRIKLPTSIGRPYKNAAEFHVNGGVATPAEYNKVYGRPAQKSRLGRMLGRIGIRR